MKTIISPFKITLIFVLISLIGTAVVPRLSVNLVPNYTPPALQISFRLPGSDPKTLEESVTAPLENSLSRINGIKSINSVSGYEQGQVSLAFDRNENMAFKKFEVSSLIRQLYPELPELLEYPTINQTDKLSIENTQPLLIYSVSAPIAPNQIQSIIEDQVVPAILLNPDVQDVKVDGANGIRFVIEYLPEQLIVYQIKKESILDKIASSFSVSFPGPIMNESNQYFYTKIGDALKSPNQIENLLIHNSIGDLVPLRKLVRVKLEEQPAEQYYRINGLNSIIISVYSHERVNRLNLAKALKLQMTAVSRILPANYHLQIDYDDTTYIESELDKLYLRSGLSILILLILILLVKRDLKYLVSLLSGIVINIFITLLIAYLLGISIHLYTLAGMAISFGIVIDNAIIMLDHIQKKRNIRIFVALLAASLTTISALSLVLFLPEGLKQNLLEFAEVIILALLVSLVIALFYTPAIYKLINSDHPERSTYSVTYKTRWLANFREYYFRGIQFLASYRRIFLTVVLLGFGTPLFLLPSHWQGQNWYNSTIGSDIYQNQIRTIIDPLLGGAIRPFVRNVFEKSFYRSVERTKLIVHAELPFGHTLSQMNEVASKVEEYLQLTEGVDQYLTRVYSGQYARITITFKDSHTNSIYPFQLKNQIITRSLEWGGVKWTVLGVGKGFINQGGDKLPSFQVKLLGYNYMNLELLAKELRDKLISHKRIQKVDIDAVADYGQKQSSELALRFDPNRLVMANSDRMEVINTLNFRSMHLEPALVLNYNQTMVPLFLQSTIAERFSKQDLALKSLPISRSRSIRLATFTDINQDTIRSSLYKEDRQYVRIVGFEYLGNSSFGKSYLDEVLKDFNAQTPAGYSAFVNTLSRNTSELKPPYSMLILVLIVIYFICAILFENLSQPLFIIMTVPISFIGLFLVFTLFNFNFDQGGYAAFIMLGGLVVNAAIFIVNDLNNFSQKNYNHNIIRAVCGKAQPIMLTVLSTCFGLVPFLLEGQNEVFWFSLAIGTIGGLVFSFFAVFICLPVFLFNKKKHSLKGI